MCVDCVLASLRIAQVDPGDGPLPEVVLSQRRVSTMNPPSVTHGAEPPVTSPASNVTILPLPLPQTTLAKEGSGILSRPREGPLEDDVKVHLVP
jgi:hypothetical protein